MLRFLRGAEEETVSAFLKSANAASSCCQTWSGYVRQNPVDPGGGWWAEVSSETGDFLSQNVYCRGRAVARNLGLFLVCNEDGFCTDNYFITC